MAIKVFDQGLSAEQAATLATALRRLCDAPLDHPSILAPIGAGLNGDTAWVAEPDVANATPLETILRRRGPLPLADVLLRLTQVAGALDFAAATSVCHGALHPRDIIFAGDRTLVTGLGVVQALAEAHVEVPTAGPAVSPQRAAGLPVTPADDIFALGAIAFESLYGRPLSDRSHLASLVAPLDGVDRGRLREALQRALAENPSDRPATALEFAKALQECVVNSDMSADESRAGADAGSALVAAVPLPLPVDDLPLRASLPERTAVPERESTTAFEPVAEEFRNPTPNLVQNPDVLNSNSNAGSEPRSGWLAMAAMLVVGLLTGFAAGFILGQRDVTPVPRSAERAVPRAQRQAAQEPVAAPTVGQDFTESAVAESAEGRRSAAERRDANAEVRAQAVREVPLLPVEKEPARASAGRGAPADSGEPTRASRPSASSASMEIVSRPAGAQVYIDGRVVGRTPLVLADVNPGDHSVRIALPGHQRWATTVNVSAGSRARVAASLER